MYLTNILNRCNKSGENWEKCEGYKSGEKEREKMRLDEAESSAEGKSNFNENEIESKRRILQTEITVFFYIFLNINSI